MDSPRFARRSLFARLVVPTSWQDQASDDERLRLIATVELAIAQLYDEARVAGHLDSTAGEIAARFASHHRLHAESLSVDAGTTITVPNAAFLQEMSAKVTTAGTGPDALRALLDLEQAIAATHLATLGIVASAASAGTVGQILPIECEHAVVLGLLLGQPLPDLVTANGEEPLGGALDLAKYPVP